MEFRTIIAKKVGTCARCEQPIYVGDRIRWAAGRGAYHLSAECPAVAETDVPRGTVHTDTVILAECGTPITVRVMEPVVSTELVANARPAPVRVVCSNRLPDADEMLAAFGVKS